MCPDFDSQRSFHRRSRVCRPPDTSIALLQPFLESTVRELNSAKRNSQIIRNVVKGDNILNSKARAESLYALAAQCKAKGNWQSALQHYEKAADGFAGTYGELHTMTKETRAQALFVSASFSCPCLSLRFRRC